MRQQRNTFRLAPIAATLIAMGATIGTVQAQEVTVTAPALSGWNTENTLTVNGTSQNGQTFIYPTTVLRDTDEAGDSDGTGSVGYISWQLDDGSGREPGIQVVNNLGFDDYKLKHCIMASGLRPDENDPDTLVAKSCGDPQSSAKRYKLVATDAGTGVDLVFDTAEQDLTYRDADPGEDGRVYRVFQKLINDTDERIQALRVELGTGTGGTFTPLDPATTDIGFELRPTIPRTFFGETGDGPDVEVWDPNEYAVFSPSMFYVGDDPADPEFRFDEGFFDTANAGLFPPDEFEVGDQSQYIDSGTAANGDIFGATTANYFDLPANQGAVAEVPITGTVFGYMLPDSQLPTGIYEDEDGDAATEGELVAWWDGNDWRYGQDKDFAIVPDSQLVTWAERPLSEDEVLPGPRYEAALIDDLGSINMDFFIYLGESFDTVNTQTVTMRVIAEPVTGTVAGSDEPLWMSSKAPSLESYLDDGTDDSTTIGGGGGGGCTIGGNRPFDPLLPGLALAALGYLGLRRRWNA